MGSTFSNCITTEAELRTLYREPTEVVKSKSVDHLDAACRSFIERSTFVLLGTSDGDKQDVSPKGGPAGFVKVIDDNHLAIPDLNGNNRLDGLRGILEHPRIGLLFLIPGMGETLRVTGEACITTDDAVLDLFVDELRRPKTAIGVTVHSSFLHCAKAFIRGGIWAPETWPTEDATPSAGEILVAHAEIDGITGAQLDAMLADGYADDLAADRPA